MNRDQVRAVLVRHRTDGESGSPGVLSADLTAPDGTRRVLDAIRDRHGPVGAVLHLLPLRRESSFAESDLQVWRRRVQRDLKSLYNLARVTEPDLGGRGRRNGAMFIVVTGMGGTFDHSTEAPSTPTHGGVAASVKTLAEEWPNVRCKVIDVNPLEPVPVLQKRIWGELLVDDELVQVGYSGDRRVTIVQQPAALVDARPTAGPGVSPDSEWVFLLTGGARGITAEIASYLARTFRPTLVLAGLSLSPASRENPATAGLNGVFELKTAIAASLRARTGEPVGPAGVERSYRRLLRQREIRRNLENLRRHGANVEYHGVDVRDERAFGELIEGIYRRHGRLDVVVHGAGIIEDKLLKDKTPDSFDRVLHTKTDSAFILARTLRPESLKILVFMSSVTAVFGNRGQLDYAAANGVLNSIATLLSRRWPGRVVALDWGPWDKTGMVSDEVREQFLRRGVQMIPLAGGVEAFARELVSARRAEPVVVFGDGPWRDGREMASKALGETA